MKIKAIALDLDGTLLNSEKKISPKTKEILMQAQNQGITVILASGRPTSGVLPVAKELKMDEHHGIIISYNGAKATDCSTKEEIYQKLLTVEEGKAVLEHLKQFDVVRLVDHQGYMYVEDVYGGVIDWDGAPRSIPQWESRGGNFLLREERDLAKALDFKAAKITAAGPNEYLTAHEKEMTAPFLGELNAMFTSKYYFEFTAKDVDKATALQAILPKINSSQKELIAFGDGHNDVAMIQLAGLGVAMKNAETPLLEVADEITLGHDEEGIYHLLKKYL